MWEARLQTGNPFETCGLAARDDLEHPLWKSLLEELERLQERFLQLEPHPPGYECAREPLHTWSRVWEYPYVLYQIRRFASTGAGAGVAVDFGCGITFFPFAVAREGLRVICVDTDERCGPALERASQRLLGNGGRVEFRLSAGSEVPLPNGLADIVYSVSVFEHLADPVFWAGELARILRPGGLLVLTLDLALDSHSTLGLGPDVHHRLLQALARHCDWVYPFRYLHPGALLSPHRSPYPFYPDCGPWSELWEIFKQRILKPALGRRPRIWRLACEGLVCCRRAPEVGVASHG